MGVPLDDTWIHFQFADNFSKGYFFQFNPGEFTAGTTSPLYVVVLGTFSFIIKNFILSSIFLSFTFSFLSCIFIYRLSVELFSYKFSPLTYPETIGISPELISLIVSLLTVFSGRIAWASLSGMETTMFIFFSILGVYFHIKNLNESKHNICPVLFIALATVSRPEGYLLASLFFFDLILNLIKNKEFKKHFLFLLISAVIFGMITIPYLIFSYNISGFFFPNTFRGQGGDFRIIPNFEYLRIATIYFFRDNLITAMLYFFSIIFYFANLKKYFSELKLMNLIFLWIIFLPLVSSLLIPNWRHHVRYLIPLIPFINIASVYMLLVLLKTDILSGLKVILLKRNSLISLIIVFSFIYYIVYAVAFGRNTDNINDQQVTLAKWVNKNVGRNETIALNDIGAITFINKNRIVDMAGLVTPEVLRYRNYQWKDNLDSLNYLLKKNNVSYIIIYDEWFREYLNVYGKDLTFMTSAILEDNTICGGIEMKVYKTNF